MGTKISFCCSRFLNRAPQQPTRMSWAALLHLNADLQSPGNGVALAWGGLENRGRHSLQRHTAAVLRAQEAASGRHAASDGGGGIPLPPRAAGTDAAARERHGTRSLHAAGSSADRGGAAPAVTASPPCHTPRRGSGLANVIASRGVAVGSLGLLQRGHTIISVAFAPQIRAGHKEHTCPCSTSSRLN